MKDSLKSFFYNPNWRLGVYIYVWCYIWCFRLLSHVFPKLKNILNKYKYGDSLSAGKIGLTSGAVFWAVFIFIFCRNISLSAGGIIMIALLLPIFALLGWFSLIRYRDYEIEKEKYGKI